MISGDNLQTAIQMAKKAGILQDGDEQVQNACMTGAEFRSRIGEVVKIVGKDGKQKYEISNQKEFTNIA